MGNVDFIGCPYRAKGNKSSAKWQSRVTKDRTAIKIAGAAWKSPQTYYTIRDKVIPGSSLDPAHIEKGMHVWMRK